MWRRYCRSTNDYSQTLNDFKSNSCFAGFAYGFLWFSLFLSVAVYAVDIFTAVQLLAFNNWASAIKPVIDFDISKWIFSICIILSIVNLGFEHIRARRVMNRGSVAECFLDSLAARLESIRMRQGRGWRRFLVFAELTKSKKGSEYIALFTYFSFQSWIRVLLCSGPRQVLNALTIYSVYSAKLADGANGNNFESSFLGFFDALKKLAEEDTRQVVILSGMLFTLVIWVFSAISLLLAAIFFVFYLWHIIPRDDGGLTGFCERKINKRLKQIVSKKINKAMAEDERKRRKEQMKAAKQNGGDRPMTMQPTLPTLPGAYGDDKLPAMPSLKRTETMMTTDSSRPSTPGSYELNALGRPAPSRTATTATAASYASYSSKTSLLGGAAEPGRSASPAPTLPPIDMNNYGPNRAPTLPNIGRSDYPLPPVRTATAASNRSFGPGPQLQRMPSSTLGTGYSDSPATYSTDTMPPFPAPVRSPTGGTTISSRDPGPYPGSIDARPTYDEYSNGRASPAPTNRSGPLSPRGMGPDGYPMRSATNPYPMPPRGPQPYPPQRNMTAPINANNSQRMMAGPVHPPQHRPNDSNGSVGTMRSQPPGQQQQQYGFNQSQSSGDWGYDNGYNTGNNINRPMTASSQRSGPGPSRPGYGSGGSNGNGWNQDVERGGDGRRY